MLSGTKRSLTHSANANTLKISNHSTRSYVSYIIPPLNLPTTSCCPSIATSTSSPPPALSLSTARHMTPPPTRDSPLLSPPRPPLSEQRMHCQKSVFKCYIILQHIFELVLRDLYYLLDTVAFEQTAQDAFVKRKLNIVSLKFLLQRHSPGVGDGFAMTTIGHAHCILAVCVHDNRGHVMCVQKERATHMSAHGMHRLHLAIRTDDLCWRQRLHMPLLWLTCMIAFTSCRITSISTLLSNVGLGPGKAPFYDMKPATCCLVSVIPHSSCRMWKATKSNVWPVSTEHSHASTGARRQTCSSACKLCAL